MLVPVSSKSLYLQKMSQCNVVEMHKVLFFIVFFIQILSSRSVKKVEVCCVQYDDKKCAISSYLKVAFCFVLKMSHVLCESF